MLVSRIVDTCMSRDVLPYWSGVREFEMNRWDEAGGFGIAEQTPDRGTATLTVIKREIVDIHADKTIGPRAIEAATKLHRVLHCLVSMLEAECNTVVQQPRQRIDVCGAQVAFDDVAAERQRQAAGAIGPPFPEVDDF